MIYEQLSRRTSKNELLSQMTAKLVAEGTAVVMVSLNEKGEIKYEMLDNDKVRIDLPEKARGW